MITAAAKATTIIIPELLKTNTLSLLSSPTQTDCISPLPCYCANNGRRQPYCPALQCPQYQQPWTLLS